MKIIMNYTIKQSASGQTVEKYLKSLGYSQSLLRQLRNTPDGITIDNTLVYTTYRLSEGQNLTISFPEETGSDNIVPVPMSLTIPYEDEHLMVINKASGIPIHPSQGNYDNTLANGIAYYLGEKGESCTYRVINRLDRDTTGLLIIAKNPLSACILSNMVKNRTIKRRYLAIAKGKLPDQGTIDAPIARVTDSTIERCVDFERGESAITHYKRLWYDNSTDHSLAALQLTTGRTHQIRVHLKYIGHPLPGDFLYCEDYRYINRQALHSWRLDFTHPILGTAMHFEAPLPEDMRFTGIKDNLFTN